MFYLHRIYKALAKAGKFEENKTVLDMLEKLAVFGIGFAQEQTDKLLKGLIKEGPRTGEQKKEVAITAMRSIAPPGVKFTDQQAAIAVEAVLSKSRSIAPPPARFDAFGNAIVGTDGQTTYYSSSNPGPP